MKLLKFILAASLALATGQQAIAVQPAERFDKLVEDYKAWTTALELPLLDMGYKDLFNETVSRDNMAEQKRSFTGYLDQLAAFNPTALDSCQQVMLKTLSFELPANLERLAIAEQIRSRHAITELETERFNDLPMHEEWYQYVLDHWLTVDTSPEELAAFGKRELKKAKQSFSRIQEKMGYSGRDKAFYAYLSGPEFKLHDYDDVLKEVIPRRKIVQDNMYKLFKDYGIEPSPIKQSEFGDAFPAFGYYIDDEMAFYINMLSGGFDVRFLDLTVMHEDLPGHHFQHFHKERVADCNTLLPGVYYHTYTEGWGVYIEEFGHELGLYRSLTDYLGSIEWDIVRSVRVIVDVGMNYYGWSRQQALDYWSEAAPMIGPQAAERETDRVLDWPVQAIGYKVGADIFRKLRQEVKEQYGDRFDIAEFHDLVLKNGALPMSVLQSVVREHTGIDGS